MTPCDSVLPPASYGVAFVVCTVGVTAMVLVGLYLWETL